MSRIFFFANDPDDGEIVYRVTQFADPIPVPAVSVRPWVYQPTNDITTGNASDVIIYVDPAGLVTIDYLQTAIEIHDTSPDAHDGRFAAMYNYINEVLSTISFGLNVPVEKDLESDILDISNYNRGDCFMVQEMDVSSPGVVRSGMVWVNYTDNDPAQPLIFYHIIDQFDSPDMITIIYDENDNMAVDMEHLNDNLNFIKPDGNGNIPLANMPDNLSDLIYVTGSYTGDNTANRIINLGFTPKALYVNNLYGVGNTGIFGGLVILGYNLAGNNSGMTTWDGTSSLGIVTNGFMVQNGTGSPMGMMNSSARTYWYIAFK